MDFDLYALSLTMRSVVARQLGVLFDVVLLIKVESWNQKCPQRLLGRRIEDGVHVSHKLRYVPAHHRNVHTVTNQISGSMVIIKVLKC